MLNFIYNERSGKGKGKKIIKIIKDYLTAKNVEFATFSTRERGDATAIAKDLSARGETDIIAVGGDGTMHEVLNGINTETVNLGIIPAGSGNDFVQSAKIPMDTKKALDVILQNQPKPTDYLDCSGIKGLNIIGTGIDVEILTRCEKYKFFTGKIQYFLSLIISLIKFKFYKFDTIVKNNRTSHEALVVCCGNGKMFGGGIPMCPNAKIDDGLIDFVVCNKMKKSKILNALIKLMKGKILEQDFTEFSLEKQVEVCFDKPTVVNVDGELYPDLPFYVQIKEKGLKLYRP